MSQEQKTIDPQDLSGHNYSETRKIGFWRMCAFLTLGPLILPVYMFYSFGYLLKRNGYDEGWWRLFTVPLVVLFSVVNALHNFTVCTILFMEFPRELTTTARLKRHKTHPNPAKRELADMLGGFLNRQDPNHY